MLAAPTILAAVRSPHGNTSDRPIPRSHTKKKKSDTEFSEKFGNMEKFSHSKMPLKKTTHKTKKTKKTQLKMHSF
jgi:hypothetical protein